MYPLSFNLVIMFGTRLIIDNMLNTLRPLIKFRLKYDIETMGVQDKSSLTDAELDYFRLAYNPIQDSIEFYSDLLMEYAFMTLFVVALPVSCFLSVINVLFKTKFTIYKCLKVSSLISKFVRDNLNIPHIP